MVAAVVKVTPQTDPVLVFLTAGPQSYLCYSLLPEPTVTERRKKRKNKKKSPGLPFTEMQKLRKKKNSASF